ncbi:MAG: hypothetical protein NC453_16630 [Muribaculum sp.]|nr:hypothetical protein [Muribaculum sp.]
MSACINSLTHIRIILIGVVYHFIASMCRRHARDVVFKLLKGHLWLYVFKLKIATLNNCHILDTWIRIALPINVSLHFLDLMMDTTGDDPGYQPVGITRIVSSV